MKIIIDSERYGQRTEFASLEAAVAGLRSCGEAFATTDLSIRADGEVLDEDGVIVGDAQDDAQAPAWKVRMDKHRSTWNWFTTNPQGGGFGSNHCGTKAYALAAATRNLPDGTVYELTCNGKVSIEVAGR